MAFNNRAFEGDSYGPSAYKNSHFHQNYPQSGVVGVHDPDYLTMVPAPLPYDRQNNAGTKQWESKIGKRGNKVVDHTYEEIPANQNPAIYQSRFSDTSYRRESQGDRQRGYGNISQMRQFEVPPPPPYQTKTYGDPSFVQLPHSPSSASLLSRVNPRSRSCKITMVVLLCLALLVAGVIIGLFVSGALNHMSDNEEHSTTMRSLTTTAPSTASSELPGPSSSDSGLSPSTSSPSVSTVTMTTESTKDSSTESPPGSGEVIYGQWTNWVQWSDCSSTCGQGVRNRTRVCKKSSPTDLDCPGNKEDLGMCNLGNCPNCSMECSGSFIQDDCLACHCPFNDPRTIRILNTKMTPLEGATISRQEVGYDILATTDKNGSATVKNACIGDKYVIKKEHYLDATVEITSDLNYEVVITTRARVNMKLHPQDAVALLGDDLTLSCFASGTTPSDTYQWLRNGVLLAKKSNNSTLVLRNVGKQDAGQYSCMVESAFSVAMSRPALVRVKENGYDFCDHQPKEHIKLLPNDCPQDGSHKYNVGQCGGNSCAGEKTESDASYCCGPIKQDSRQISCNGYSLDISVVLECGCIVCNQVNTSNGLITERKEVTFSGRVFDMSNPTVPFRVGEVHFYDEKVTSSFFGYFQIKIPSGTNRIVLNFKNDLEHRFLEGTKVFNIPSDFAGTLYKEIPLMTKSKATVLNLSAKEENRIPLANSSVENRPLAEVLIAPNTFYTDTGDAYHGNVTASVLFIDPRDSTSFENIVGDLTYIDNNGNVGALQTFGMLNLDFKDDKGNPLGIQGEVHMAIDANFIGAQHGDTSVKLWSMNPTSGRWEFESNMIRGTKADPHKRDQANYDSTFFIGNVVITDRYWFNFDDDQLNYCFVKIKTFSDATLSMELPWSVDNEATVIAIDPTKTGQWAQVTTGSMSYDSNTDISSRDDCIMTICGNGSFTGYVMVNHPDGPFNASTDIGGKTPPNTVVEITTTSLGNDTNQVNYDRVINTTVKPLTDNYGPIYHFQDGYCRDQNSFFCKSCFDDDWVIPDCQPCDSWYCSYPASKAFHYCAANVLPSYYVFHQELANYEYTVCEEILQCITTPEFVWYPKHEAKIWAWYIKIKVEYEFESVVRAVSEGGKHIKTQGHIYGIREATTREKTTCLEFKGSGDIYVTSHDKEDETLVSIDVQGTDCQIESILPDLQTYQVTPSSGIFGFQLPSRYTSSGDSTGIYFSSHDYIDNASREAKARCECGDIQLGSPICSEYNPNAGVGLTVRCMAIP
ncbi:unnamed protein product [Owenia fusiformis]|uniref:Uncharacterized protein n=1 Tax=Owenia fusiformis TaxID=6347 RepID=A0A8J1U756_OWEFU|nr:unnamed protein product [Owenia fusiformis]